MRFPEKKQAERPLDNSASHVQRSWWWVIPILFVSIIIIHLQLERTLMGLLTASRWLALFWASSFLLLYFVRQKLEMDVTDGLIVSLFGIAPLLMAAMLTVNRHFHEPFTETHRIVNIELDGEWAEIRLENDAYEDFYRIRHVPVWDMPLGDSVTYQFGHGALGWQVLIDRH